MSTRGYLSGLSGLLRRVADRLDYANAPKAVGWSFTFEANEGIRFRDDGRGCPLWHLGDGDYERAHVEADTRHVKVDWQSMAVTYPGGSAEAAS